MIPACPLALDAQRKLDENRQRALVRYYRAAGVGGIAVGVHTTQFAIRDPRHGLFEPLLALVADELARGGGLVGIGGVCGEKRQAIAEATTLTQLGYN
ncbi:MAG TPA: dihydrodipicolinate synthase family protein, partial [Chthoniobacteraceae bacterium]|nr:dihydrodipicolinate synthase family protein [Chthoniobacteraceae bacterium]